MGTPLVSGKEADGLAAWPAEPPSTADTAWLLRELKCAREQISVQRESLRIASINEELRSYEIEGLRRRLQRHESPDALRIVQDEVASRLLSAFRLHDKEAASHILRVGLYCRMIARHLGLGEEAAEVVFR